MISQNNKDLKKMLKYTIINVKKLLKINKEEGIKLVGSLIQDYCLSINKAKDLFEISWVTAKKYFKLFLTNQSYKVEKETRGRKGITYKFPDIIEDINKIVDDYSSTDPKFNTEKRYVRLTISEIKNRLIETGKYTIDNSPKKSTLSKLLNKIGYNLKKVQKTKPLKKIPETDEIFDNLKEKKDIALSKDNVVLISIDTKDKVLIGPYSRKGKNRIQIDAVDHELTNNCVIPFGILDIKNNKPYFYNFKHKPTSEAIVEAIEDFWKNNYLNSKKTRLSILLDNGPDNGGYRTSFLYNLHLISLKYNITIELIYYPPYHSKYNPIERLWARLENIWNGSLIETIDICISFMKNLTWKGKIASVKFIDKLYEKGITIDKTIMKKLESKFIVRHPVLSKYYLLITPFYYPC